MMGYIFPFPKNSFFLRKFFLEKWGCFLFKLQAWKARVLKFSNNENNSKNNFPEPWGEKKKFKEKKRATGSSNAKKTWQIGRGAQKRAKKGFFVTWLFSNNGFTDKNLYGKNFQNADQKKNPIIFLR